MVILHFLRAAYTVLSNVCMLLFLFETELNLIIDLYTLPKISLQDCLASMGVLESATLTELAKVKDKESSDVGKFLNRILGLRFDRQNLVCLFERRLEKKLGHVKMSTNLFL